MSLRTPSLHIRPTRSVVFAELRKLLTATCHNRSSRELRVEVGTRRFRAGVKDAGGRGVEAEFEGTRKKLQDQKIRFQIRNSFKSIVKLIRTSLELQSLQRYAIY